MSLRFNFDDFDAQCAEALEDKSFDPEAAKACIRGVEKVLAESEAE